MGLIQQKRQCVVYLTQQVWSKQKWQNDFFFFYKIQITQCVNQTNKMGDKNLYWALDLKTLMTNWQIKCIFTGTKTARKWYTIQIIII